MLEAGLEKNAPFQQKQHPKHEFSPSGPEPEGLRARAAREPRAERHHPGAVSPTTWTRRGSGPSASRPCRSWTTRWWWTASWISPSQPCGTFPTSCTAATRSSSPPSNSGRVCVARQLAELMRLPLQEVLSDFDAICLGAWREQGITPRHIRSFCVWRQSPDVLRGLPGPPAGQVRACGQGAAGCGLHKLERPRLLLQVRPHRREVRADRGPGPGQIPG